MLQILQPGAGIHMSALQHELSVHIRLHILFLLRTDTLIPLRHQHIALHTTAQYHVVLPLSPTANTNDNANEE